MTRKKGRHTRSDTTPNRILVQERRRKALEFRKAGWTYAMIASELGVSVQTAGNYVTSAMKELVREPAEGIRDLQRERLLHLLATVWPSAISPKADNHEWAVGEVQRIMDRLNLLDGVNAPQTVQHSVEQQIGVLVIDGSKDDYIQSLRQMAGEESLPELESGSNDPLLKTRDKSRASYSGFDPEEIIEVEVIEDL